MAARSGCRACRLRAAWRLLFVFATHLTLTGNRATPLATVTITPKSQVVTSNALFTGLTVTTLAGAAQGRLRRAHLSDGSTLETEVALGAIRDSRLAAGTVGVACDAECRAFDVNGRVTDDVFVAGDVARFPHPLYHSQLLSLEHWGNAVEQARVAAHNMVCAAASRRPHVAVPFPSLAIESIFDAPFWLPRRYGFTHYEFVVVIGSVATKNVFDDSPRR